MNLPDSLACEQALGVWDGRGTKGGFRSLTPPPPPGSLLPDALLIKIGGSIGQVFFFFAFLWTETKSKSIITLKIDRGQYIPVTLTKQAWSTKIS